MVENIRKSGGTVTDAIARTTPKSENENESEPLMEEEQTLREAIENITGKPAGDEGGARSLGRWIKHYAGRITGGGNSSNRGLNEKDRDGFRCRFRRFCR
jgi:hypothetical protein